ncbi:MAG: class I SAM-dependent methyltransferase [Oscillospiraceae bacterium]|nr:class I SAM-dependent methyltransferase [Oscillospiraceae bacterium]
MYGEAFSKIYNEFGWNYYPEAFAGQLIRWLEENGIQADSLLDIGCGTGILCEIMADRGLETLGVDLSENMIAIARSRRPELAYEIGNMITWQAPRSFDLVTCTGDALNHIPNLADVAQAFRQVFTALNPGGYFLFDILNEKETEESGIVDLDYSDTVKGQFSITHEENGLVHLCVRVYDQGVLTCEEHIREMVHQPEDICRLLEQAGFTSIVCRHHLTEDDSSRAMTWFVIAKKP